VSPIDTFVSSCGVNLNPAAPALIVWTWGVLDGVGLGVDDANPVMEMDLVADDAILDNDDTTATVWLCATTAEKIWLEARTAVRLRSHEGGISFEVDAVGGG
jgi:hypothetical protein